MRRTSLFGTRGTSRRAGAVLRLLAVHEPELIFGVDQVPGGYDRAELGRLERKRIAGELEKTAEAVGPGIEVQHHLLEGTAAAVVSRRKGTEPLG
jgi:hypothetical protein